MLERRVAMAGGEERLCVIGPLGAVDFHGHKPHPAVMAAMKEHGSDTPTCGLEYHQLTAPDYDPDRPADFAECWLTGKPCWCDGTSSYASEHLYPLWKAFGTEGFWPYLESAYRDYFEKDPAKEDDRD